jgi:polyisoprenoid-binding protein YceI
MSAFPPELTGTWDIDTAHSTVGFAAKHAVVATTRGHFTSYTGGAVIDAERPEQSSLWVEIDAASVTTGNEQRDGHLQSADFFDVENHLKITFTSTSVAAKGDQIVTVGDLTIAGNSAPVELVWDFNGIAKDPWGNTKAGFESEVTINRKDWGLQWNAALETGGFLVSEKVKLVLEIEAGKRA